VWAWLSPEQSHWHIMPMGLTQHKQTGAKKQEQLDRTNPLAHLHPQALIGHRQLFAVFFQKTPQVPG
jgi:hypothetical protein